MNRLRRLLCQALGEFDQNAPIGRVRDFPERHDEPQPFEDIHVDLIVPK
jgi:hypothetical protein